MAIRHPALLDRNRAALAVIDVQEAFAKIIPDFGELADRVALLVEAANLLKLPVIVTEQYPKGLGPTVPDVAAKLPAAATRIEKTAFSACGALPLDRPQVVIAGMEAHVCVMQTALGFREKGYEVFVAADTVGSRKETDRSAALERLRAAGCSMASAEMAMFEWMENADVPEFREVLNLVKNL